MDIPYTTTNRPDTGLYNAKIGIWLFLASEVMLFGGLFSSYIFLRIGADFHWPVHELQVLPGFINTLVLILSSVTVVMAWANLKMRKIAQYKLCMWITILCAGVFMCLKAYEYYGKFNHIGVKLTDGTILTGHFPEGGYRVKLEEGTKVTINLKTGDPSYFLKWVTTENPKFKNAAGEDVLLDQQGSVMSLLDVFLPGDWDKSSFGQLKRTMAEAKKTSVELTAVTPLTIVAKESKTFGHTGKTITFRDGTIVEGRAVEDKMTLQVDKVDVRAALDEEKSLAWHYLGDEWKKAFEEHGTEEAEKHKSFDKNDERFLRHVKQMEIHAPTVAEHNAKHGGAKHSAETHAPAEGAHGAEGHGSHYPEVVLERKDIGFWSSFTPKWNNYYAIYFTLTGLHGLHVVAGALVLAYFLLFDGKRLKEDPEHLANRIEVGGLFWHFVDLVWIFLFPLLYLL